MLKKIINNLKKDHSLRTFVFSVFSVLLTLSYSIYNGFLGIYKLSIWHGSICIYYLLLLIIRTILVFEMKNNNEKRKKIMHFVIYALLFIITISMIAPAIFLIIGKRTYDLGLIPAISMAAYTTYSVTFAIINYYKTRTNNNTTIKQLKLINVIAALMSVIVLQNTLILANGEMNENMKTMCFYTSFAIIFAAIFLIIIQFIRYIKTPCENGVLKE